MKLLEKSASLNSARGVPEKKERAAQEPVEKAETPRERDSAKLSKHKKTASGPIHRIDLAKAFENVQSGGGAKTEVRDEKNVSNKGHVKGKGSLTIAPGVGIESTIANITINLNDSEAKLSSRTSKRVIILLLSSMLTLSYL